MGTSLNLLSLVDSLGVIVTHIALLDECYSVCRGIVIAGCDVTVLGEYEASSSLNLLSAVVGHVDPVTYPDVTGSRVVHPSVRMGGLGRLAGLRRLAGSRARVRRAVAGRLGTSVAVSLIAVILGRRGRLGRLVVDTFNSTLSLYALAGCSAIAILVVHIGLCLVSTVVFFVRAGRDALCLVDGFHAIVTEVTLLNEFNGMRCSHA